MFLAAAIIAYDPARGIQASKAGAGG